MVRSAPMPLSATARMRTVLASRKSRLLSAPHLALAEIGRKNREAALRYIELFGDNRGCRYTHIGVDPFWCRPFSEGARSGFRRPYGTASR
jgi:hypothetical protein